MPPYFHVEGYLNAKAGRCLGRPAWRVREESLLLVSPLRLSAC
jgi:hypothetical protein